MKETSNSILPRTTQMIAVNIRTCSTLVITVGRDIFISHRIVIITIDHRRFVGVTFCTYTGVDIKSSDTCIAVEQLLLLLSVNNHEPVG